MDIKSLCADKKSGFKWRELFQGCNLSTRRFSKTSSTIKSEPGPDDVNDQTQIQFELPEKEAEAVAIWDPLVIHTQLGLSWEDLTSIGFSLRAVIDAGVCSWREVSEVKSLREIYYEFQSNYSKLSDESESSKSE